MLKYVELHEDSEPSINPWAIRQALIYQKYFHQSRESSHVFVRLSSAMQLALKGVLQKSSNQDDFISRWESVHQLFLGTLNANWRDFINYLDHEVSIIVSCMSFLLAETGLISNRRQVRPGHPVQI